MQHNVAKGRCMQHNVIAVPAPVSKSPVPVKCFALHHSMHEFLNNEGGIQWRWRISVQLNRLAGR